MQHMYKIQGRAPSLQTIFFLKGVDTVCLSLKPKSCETKFTVTHKLQPSRDKEVSTLTLILLGIRTTHKVDLQCTSAEIVFGTTLRLPGELITISEDNKLSDPSDFVDKLKLQMGKLQPALTRPSVIKTNFPKDLHNCSHVWVRVDAVRKPLQPPYKGPFKVIERKDQYFDVNGKPDSVSSDRVKVAYLDEDLLVNNTKHQVTRRKVKQPSLQHQPVTETKTALRTTRSGRKVHWPKRLVEEI